MVPTVFKRQATAIDAAVLQAQGGVGNASMTDPQAEAMHQVLLYRLVSLNSDGPWGAGKLMEIEKANDTEDKLKTALHMLMERPWRNDPVRRHVIGLSHNSASDNLAGAVCDAKKAKEWEGRGSEFEAGFCRLRQLKTRGRLGDKFTEPAETWGQVLAHSRGSVGETALHLLFLLNTPQHRRLIRILVPWLGRQHTRDANDEVVSVLDASYLGQPYNGEVALHFAVIQQDTEMVKLLVAHGANVNKHASGNFMYSNPDLYFGGTILGFAACLGNVEIVDFLLQSKANVNARDEGPLAEAKHRSFPLMQRNNSVLHCCVLHDQAEMYTFLTTHGANPWVMNDAGDTPLLLATSCRSLRMLQIVMDGQKETLWSFGPVSCVRYPLYEIENSSHSSDDVMGLLTESLNDVQERVTNSLVRRVREASRRRVKRRPQRVHLPHRRTVLQVIDKEDAFELLYNDVLWELCKDKWTGFARAVFIFFVFLNVVSLMAQTLSQCTAVEMERCEGVLLLIWIPVPLRGIPALTGDIACAINLAITMWLLLARVFTQLRLNKSLWGDLIEIASCLLPWFGMPLRFSNATLGAHRVVLGFASALGWMRFLQDSFKYSPELGPLVLMVNKIVVENVLPFMAMFFCFFTMTFSLLWGVYGGILTNTDTSSPDLPPPMTVYQIVLLLFRYTINPDTAYHVRYDTSDWGGWGLDVVAGGVQALWVVLSNIVLLNAVIAMMNTTYSAVHDEQEGQWRLQYLEQVLFYEALPPVFVPSFLDRNKRPPRHVRGKLTVLSPEGRESEVECWFVQMETTNSKATAQPGGGPPRGAKAPAAAAAGGGGAAEHVEARFAELKGEMEATVERTVRDALAPLHDKLDRLLRAPQPAAGRPAEASPAQPLVTAAFRPKRAESKGAAGETELSA